MEFSDHTTIAILRVAWVIDVAAVLIMNWAARALLRYLDTHVVDVGSAADDLPPPESRRWLWRTAGGGRVMRFAWSSAAVRSSDSTVRRYAWVMRAAIAVIAASLITMLLVTARQPGRRWSIVQLEQQQLIGATHPPRQFATMTGIGPRMPTFPDASFTRTVIVWLPLV